MSITDRYILDEAGEPVPCPDLMTWAKWVEADPERRRVGLTPIGEGRVSTVFLGLDHSWGDGPPVLWETMAFDIPGLDGEQERYTSLADAKAGHEAMVARALAAPLVAEGE